MRHSVIISLLFALLVFIPVQAQNTKSRQSSQNVKSNQSQNVKAQQDRKARLEKEISMLDRQLNDNASKSRSALNTLNMVQKNVSLKRELLAQSDAQIREYDRRIMEKDAQIHALESRLDTLQRYYSRLVYAVYKNRDTKVWYMYIFSGDNLGQVFRRYSYFRDMAASLGDQASRIRDTRDSLEVQMQEAKRLRNEANIVRTQHRQAVKSLSAEEAKSQQVVDALKRDRKRYEKEIASKRKEVETLNREIEKLIRESMNSGKGGGKSSKPVDYVLAGEFSKNKGKLPWPVDGPVTNTFGQHYHPVFTTVKMPFNNGIDISVSAGAEVKAVFNGTVRQIVVMPGYNQCVLVQHGNYFTFYCKLGSCSVKAGDEVKTGQKLGTVDAIGGISELHFQVWKDQTPQNPETWLRPR